MIARKTPLKRSTKPIARSPLQRHAPPRKKRPGVRRGEPTKAEKEQKRLYIYELSGGRCELHTHPKCIRGVLPYDGPLMRRWHLVHVRAKRRFGWPTAGPDRMRGGCFHCHIEACHIAGVPIPDLE